MKKNHLSTGRPAFILLDTIISLAVVGILIVLYASVAQVREVNRRVAFRAEAAELADEEINALKRLDVGTLVNQTNGRFVHLLMNAGNWSIATDAANVDTISSPCPPASTGQHCGVNVLSLSGSSAFTGKESGRLLFPAGGYSTATIQSDWLVKADSPAGWAAGYWLLASDKNNGYRLRVAAISTDLDSGTVGTQNLILEKISGGTVTTLFSKSNVTFPTDTWNTLKVVLTPTAATTIKIYLNGVQQDAGTINDAMFGSGAVALLGWGGVHAEVDDVMTTTNETASWDFEGSSRLPTAWVRLSVNDLPDATASVFDDNGLLSLTSYPNVNSTTLKQATVTIQWIQSTGLVQYSTTSLIGKSGVGL